jgi:hypothetical protein
MAINNKAVITGLNADPVDGGYVVDIGFMTHAVPSDTVLHVPGYRVVVTHVALTVQRLFTVNGTHTYLFDTYMQLPGDVGGLMVRALTLLRQTNLQLR